MESCEMRECGPACLHAALHAAATNPLQPEQLTLILNIDITIHIKNDATFKYTPDDSAPASITVR